MTAIMKNELNYIFRSLLRPKSSLAESSEIVYVSCPLHIYVTALVDLIGNANLSISSL